VELVAEDGDSDIHFTGRGLGCLVCFPDLAFFFCEVNALALAFSPPISFCIFSSSAETNIISLFAFPLTNVFVFASLVAVVSALLVFFL
jgi:hypothetical protein